MSQAALAAVASGRSKDNIMVRTLVTKVRTRLISRKSIRDRERLQSLCHIDSMPGQGADGAILSIRRASWKILQPDECYRMIRLPNSDTSGAKIFSHGMALVLNRFMVSIKRFSFPLGWFSYNLPHSQNENEKYACMTRH
jgi:hypothetical protein